MRDKINNVKETKNVYDFRVRFFGLKGQIDFVLEPAFCLSYATFTFINPSESVNCSPPVAFCSKGNGSGSIGHPSLELG